MTPEQIVELLERGAWADIWYDPWDHDEEGIVELIKNVQEAMTAAAQIIRSLPKEVTP